MLLNNKNNLFTNTHFLDWKWQFKNSIKNIRDLNYFTTLSDEQKAFIDNEQLKINLPFQITPYFASLMDKSSTCPLFLQVISTPHELKPLPIELKDPLGENKLSATPHLIHRYPDRVLFFATDRCAAYCRFCTRKRFVGQGPTPSHDEHKASFDYIERHKNIREIIFSGGDPLMLSNDRLEKLLKKSFSIPHIDLVRIHSRMLTFAPMRIDEDLKNRLKKYSPLYLITHFNHPREITELTKKALNRLIDCGVVLLNQSVLLKGINDNKDILKSLLTTLVKNRVRPYYLHQCDIVEGASHFRVPIKKSLKIIEKLRGHISGLCMPQFVIDTPGGHGKVALTPNPIIDEDEDNIYLKGFREGISSYPKS